MNLVLLLTLVVLFVALTPGVLVYLPPKASKLTTAVTHGLIFAVVWTLIHKPVARATQNLGLNLNLEGFDEGAVGAVDPTKKDPKK